MSVKLRKKKLANGNFSLWLDIYNKGQRTSETLSLYLTKNKTHNKETLIEAEKILTKRQYELATSDYGLVPEFKKKMNFVEYYKEYSDTQTFRRWKANYILLKEFTKGSIQINQVNEKWLEDYQKFLLERVAANTANNYFNTISIVIKKALKEKYIFINPLTNIARIKKKETQRVYLTFDEVQKLAQTPCRNQEVKRMFLFACFTGLRLSDVKKLKWGNLYNGQIEYRQKKTSSPEYLPISETAKKIIGLNEDNNILQMPENKIFKPPTESYIYINLQVWAKNAGLIKKISFHTSRHTFATLALTSGGDLYTVSKLLGHKDISTTQIYAKIIDEKKKETIDLLPNVEVKF